VVACAAILAWALQAALLAQAPPPTSFVPVSPDEIQREALPAAPLVYGAYAFVWVALLAYVFTLWRRVSKVERELQAVLKQTGRSRS
jgi:CcmD family protein